MKGHAAESGGVRGLVLLLLFALLGASGGPALAQEAVVAGPAEDGGRDAYFLTPIWGHLPATDSAAAATALACGQKTDGGNIAWAPGDPVDGALETVAERLRAERGFAIGVASTVPFNHATPAAFASHNVSRNDYTAIAHEMIFSTAPEVVVGGGFDSGYFPLSGDYQALVGGVTSYTHVVTRAAGVDGAESLALVGSTVVLSEGHRLFGLFGDSSGNFAYHDVADSPGAPHVTRGAVEDPTLADVVSVTLGVLSQDDDGFFVMFEQGDIDWSNHANDFAGMVGGVWDLDRAVRTVEEAVAASATMAWTDTLIIVTADHANSYLRLDTPLGIGDLPEQVWDGGWRYPGGEVSYRTGGHTNELVTLSARGAGADGLAALAGTWYSGTLIVDNTQVYSMVLSAVADAGARHVMLFIGDGMHLAHEVAASRYLVGQDDGLAWHGWDLLADGWRGFCATWDVGTYDAYAAMHGADGYEPDAFDPRWGYDRLAGGARPSVADSPRLLASVYVMPWEAAALMHTGSDGRALSAVAAAGAVTETLVMAYLPVDAAVDGFVFDLMAFDRGRPLSGFVPLLPLTVTLQYSATDVQGLDERSLMLTGHEVDGDDDAACGTYQRNPEDNEITAPVCGLGRFRLAGRPPLALPLLLRGL